MPRKLETPRLELRAATVELSRAEIHNRFLFARLLEAVVPSGWPPRLKDAEAQRYFLAQLEAAPEAAGWWCWYVVVKGSGAAPRTVIGTAGFKGPPTAGVVDIGYAVLPEFQGRGYATEAVRALVGWALGRPGVEAVVAETSRELARSMRLLERLGFVAGEAGSEGVLRYERRRGMVGVARSQ